MLAQFQSLYPNGSIISELLQIFQGKYIVRVSVQIEGITRATGMATAETIEAAEDNARNRALMVLGVTNAPITTTSPQVGSSIPNPTGRLTDPSYSTSQDQWAGSRESITTPTPTPTPTLMPTENLAVSKSDTSYPDFGQHLPVTNYQEPQFDTPIDHTEFFPAQEAYQPPVPTVTTSNVTPFAPRSHTTSEEIKPAEKTRKSKKSEPVDLSDIIAQTDVHIERLGWTPEQGKEYLMKTYGKRGRTLLNEDELRDFLRYLQAQPDPIAGF
ncbi:MAG TPA: hypothetical protein VK184_20915 [Nostocaceae cyanobacterium]|nr:hypothetical protein [Nostocaceae cyanobacterium]